MMSSSNSEIFHFRWSITHEITKWCTSKKASTSFFKAVFLFFTQQMYFRHALPETNPDPGPDLNPCWSWALGPCPYPVLVSGSALDPEPCPVPWSALGLDPYPYPYPVPSPASAPAPGLTSCPKPRPAYPSPYRGPASSGSGQETGFRSGRPGGHRGATSPTGVRPRSRTSSGRADSRAP